MVSFDARKFVRNELDENGVLVSVDRVTMYCKSTDTLPTQRIANGSTCIVMDKKTVLFFDEETGQWI